MKHNRPAIDNRALLLTALLVVAVCALVVVFGSGCGTTSKSLGIESKWYSAATNANAFVGNVATASSATPWGAILAAVTTAASALLGAWNSSLHKRLNALEGMDTISGGEGNKGSP